MSVFIALVLIALVVAGTLVLRLQARLRAVRERVARLEEDRIEDTPPGPPILTQPASLIETSLRIGERPVVISRPAWSQPAELRVSEWGITLHAEDAMLLIVRIPHERIVDALIVRAEGTSPLRIDWERGGERLTTTLRLEGGIRAAELIRREIHLRAKRIKLPTLSPPPPK